MSFVKLKDLQFSENFVKTGITTMSSNISVYGNNHLHHNTGMYILFSLRSIITVHGNIKFISNKVRKWKYGGTVAIFADASTLVVQRGAFVSFIENSGHDGGALALNSGAIICIRGSHAKIMFVQNHAQHYGGALYVTNTHKIFHLYKQIITVCMWHLLVVSTRHGI